MSLFSVLIFQVRRWRRSQKTQRQRQQYGQRRQCGRAGRATLSCPPGNFEVDAAAGNEIGGVKVGEVVESSAPDRLVYEPGNPLADQQGYVRMPNVNVVDEMVNTLSASRSYQANVEVMNSAKAMMLKTLSLGQ